MISPCYFIDIDTQYDFLNEKGALALHNVSEIIPCLKKLTKQAYHHKIPIIAGIEAYEAVDFETSKRKAYCLHTTKGYKKIPETSLKESFLIEKNFSKKLSYNQLLGNYSQIILEKDHFDFFSNPHTLKLLKSTKIRNCVVYGIGLDYGLQMTVERLISEGFQVWIPVDAVWSINEVNREKSLIELRKAGAGMWNTDFILENI